MMPCDFETKLSNYMKSYLQILEEAAEKENIYGIVPDLRFRLDEQTMDLIEKAADIYASQQGSINTNVVRPASASASDGELLATEAQDTVAEAMGCENVHNFSIKRFGKCLHCGGTDRMREAPSGGHL